MYDFETCHYHRIRTLLLEFNTSDVEKINESIGLWRVRKFLSPGYLDFIQRQILNCDFELFEHAIFRELRNTSPHLSLLHNFFFQDQLFQSISQITGAKPIRGIHLRVFKFEPDSNFFFPWHDDLSEGRMVGFSINLSPRPFQGGEFLIRERLNHDVRAEVHNIGYGDAILFEVSPELEHCVRPVLGDVPRIACAGWFLDRRKVHEEGKDHP